MEAILCYISQMFEFISKQKSYGAFFRKLLLFAFFFILIFSVSFGALYVLGWVPSELGQTNDLSSVDDQETSTPTVTPIAGVGATVTPIPQNKGEEPLRIVISAIGVDSPIRNIASTDVEVLDEELKKGVVRYPGSGLAGQGNMFLFGHGSNLAVVNNKAYKVFTDINKLEKGDLIKIIGKNKSYIYSVRKVTLTTAAKVLVVFDTSRTLLTLSTCNTFGAKEDRYIVESDFVSSSNL